MPINYARIKRLAQDVGVVLCGGRYAEGAGRAGTSKVVAFGGLGATNEPLTSAGVAHSGGTECTAQHGYFGSATPPLLCQHRS